MSWSALEPAFVARDVEGFRVALKALSVPVDEVIVHERPMICWLARHGWADGIQALIDEGSRPEHIPTVLQAGIFPTLLMGDDVRHLEVLVAAGADVDAIAGTLTMTPLQYAAFATEAQSEAATRLLLRHGADPLRAREGGRAPLLLALEQPVPGMVRALLEAGVSPDLEDEDGNTPLHVLLGVLRSAMDRDRETNDGSGPIARDFVSAMVHALLEHGADVSRPSATGKPLLFYALAMADCPASILEALLDAGAPCDGTIPYGDEALDYLAMSALREVPAAVARRFWDAGCPVDVSYEELGGSYCVEVARMQPAVALALWDHDAAFGEKLLSARTDRGVHMLTLALVGQGEPLSEDAVTLVHRLHAAGLSAAATSTTGKSVLDVVAEHNPSAVPLVQSLLAAER